MLRMKDWKLRKQILSMNIDFWKQPKNEINLWMHHQREITKWNNSGYLDHAYENRKNSHRGKSFASVYYLTEGFTSYVMVKSRSSVSPIEISTTMMLTQPEMTYVEEGNEVTFTETQLPALSTELPFLLQQPPTKASPHCSKYKVTSRTAISSAETSSWAIWAEDTIPNVKPLLKSPITDRISEDSLIYDTQSCNLYYQNKLEQPPS